MIFPLPLAPFELMMLLDHRAGYPMVFEIVFEFSGTINCPLWELAVALAAARHPLLTARIENIQGYPHWTPRSTVPPLVDWQLPAGEPRANGLGTEPNNPAVRVRYRPSSPVEAPSIHVQMTPTADGYRSLWRFHHAATDGMGAFITIGDVLGIYHALVQGKDHQAAVRPRDEGLLLERANFALARPTRSAIDWQPPPPRAGDWWRAAKQATTDAAEFLLRAPETIDRLPTRTDANEPEPYAGALYPLRFGAADTVAVEARARALNVTINDLLLAGMFRAIHRYREERGLREDAGVVRVLMPTNLRARQHRSMPAANMMSYAFLDRRPRDCRSVADLATGLAQATLAIQQFNLSRQFVATLAAVAPHPWIMRLGLRRPWCLSTTVVSYIGDPTRRFEVKLPRDDGKIVAGDLRLETAIGAPPVRARTHMTTAVMNYAGSLNLTAMIDRERFDGASALAVLDLLRSEVLSGA